MVYLIGQMVIRSVLFARSTYYYDWTQAEEYVLIGCMAAFFLVHISSIVALKRKERFMDYSNRFILRFELILGGIWLAINLFFGFSGMKISGLIILKILFNVLPLIPRVIAVYKTEED